MKVYRIRVDISPDIVQSYYQGTLSTIIVDDDIGRRIQLALRHFRPFMSQLGVRGQFRLEIDENGKFIALQKIN